MNLRDQYIMVDWNGEQVSIEYEWIETKADSRPVLVFLHEGLGSLAMWKKFPRDLCEKINCNALVFSRPGYGRSTPRRADIPLKSDFLHQQALAVLPALIKWLKAKVGNNSIWLVGHSDGASIALIYAANIIDSIAGVVAMAPHVMVEQKAIDSIRKAKRAYVETDMKEKLGRYHADPDSVFLGWNNVWLSEDFRYWNIEKEVETITCPLLLIQGRQDEYGTMIQLDKIEKQVKHASRHELDDCRHSPHRDQPEAVINHCREFLKKNNQLSDSC